MTSESHPHDHVIFFYQNNEYVMQLPFYYSAQPFPPLKLLFLLHPHPQVTVSHPYFLSKHPLSSSRIQLFLNETLNHNDGCCETIAPNAQGVFLHTP